MNKAIGTTDIKLSTREVENVLPQELGSLKQGRLVRTAEYGGAM
jgi:hypothetical protein